MLDKIKNRLRLTIGTKLIGLIGVLLIASLLTLVKVATDLFTEDNKALIQQSNADTAANLAAQTREFIGNFSGKVRIVGSIIIQGAEEKKKDHSSQARERIVSDIFTNDPSILLVNVHKYLGNGKFELVTSSSSPSLKELGDEGGVIAQEKISSGEILDLEQCRAGEPQVSSIKLADGSVALTLAIPFIESQPGTRQFSHIITGVVQPTQLKASFEASNLLTSYLVDRKGQLLAHPDATRVARNENVSHVEVVSQMLKGKFNNGQTSYNDPKNQEPMLGAFKLVGFAGTGVVTEIAEAKAFEAAERVRYRSLLVALIVVSFAFLAGYLYSGTITKPIRRLASAAERIKQGDLSERLPIKESKFMRGDEIQEFSATFNEMVHGLEERDKMRSTLNKIQDPRVAELLLSGELTLGGERKEATVFFSDIRGFTSLSESLEAEALVYVLNRYMDKMVKVINSYGGTVDKYVGDAIMAVWGAPIEDPSDPYNAIMACIGQRKVLQELNQEFIEEGIAPIRIGMGLNTGSLIAGQMGSEDRMDYTVIGECVNQAARIEASTKAFGTDLLVSQAVLDKVPGKFVTQPFAIKAKGVSDALVVHKIHGVYNEQGEVEYIHTDYSLYKPEGADKIKVVDKNGNETIPNAPVPGIPENHPAAGFFVQNSEKAA